MANCLRGGQIRRLTIYIVAICAGVVAQHIVVVVAALVSVPYYTAPTYECMDGGNYRVWRSFFSTLIDLREAPMSPEHVSASFGGDDRNFGTTVDWHRRNPGRRAVLYESFGWPFEYAYCAVAENLGNGNEVIAGVVLNRSRRALPAADGIGRVRFQGLLGARVCPTGVWPNRLLWNSMIWGAITCGLLVVVQRIGARASGIGRWRMTLGPHTDLCENY